MANRPNKRFQRRSYQNRALLLWKDLHEWMEEYGHGPPATASRAVQALYAARAAQCRDMCFELDTVLHHLRMFV